MRRFPLDSNTMFELNLISGIMRIGKTNAFLHIFEFDFDVAMLVVRDVKAAVRRMASLISDLVISVV